MKISQRQAAALWVARGGDPDKAHEWSAIVMGESGGDTNAHEGGNPKSCCHGIAQLNVEVGNASMKCALNPICATDKSIKLSDNGKDFSPWGAYTNGSYTHYLTSTVGFNPLDPEEILKEVSPLYRIFKGESPIPKLPLPEIGGKILGHMAKEDAKALGIDLEPFYSIAAFFKGFGELILTPEGWARLAKLLGGSIFVLWGLRIVIRESTGTDVAKTAVKGAEAAAVIATVK